MSSSPYEIRALWHKLSYIQYQCYVDLIEDTVMRFLILDMYNHQWEITRELEKDISQLRYFRWKLYKYDFEMTDLINKKF